MTQQQVDSVQLPSSWILVNLGEIVNFKNGINFTSSQKGNDGFLTIDVLNMYSETLHPKTDNLYRVDIQLKDEYLLKDGDILFVRSSVKREGVGWASVFKEVNEPVTFCGFIIRARLRFNIVLPEFLTYYLRLAEVRNKIVSSSSQVVITNISQASLGKVPVPIPPLNEQRRIVSRVEELFSVLDAGVESLRKVKAQLKRYRQAVLKYAFEGKLTEEWRKTHKDKIEPAQKLLEHVKEERKKLEGNKHKELPPLETKDLPELPENWVWTRLGEVLFQSKERFDPKSSQDERFIGLKHIESNTGRLLGYGKSSETRSTKNKFKKGELLYGKLRPYLNKVYIAEFEGVCSTDILVFLNNELVENKFIVKLMLSNDFVKRMTQLMSGVQHPRVNYQKISNYVIPLPPLLEQQEIAGKIEQHFSIADEVKKLIEQTAKQTQQLHQSILKKAFEGRLVPQDPTDESADKLLERIKEERTRHMVKEGVDKRKVNDETPKEVGLMRYV